MKTEDIEYRGLAVGCLHACADQDDAGTGELAASEAIQQTGRVRARGFKDESERRTQMSEGWTGRRCPQCDGTGTGYGGIVACPGCAGCGQEWGEVGEPNDRRIEEPPLMRQMANGKR